MVPLLYPRDELVLTVRSWLQEIWHWKYLTCIQSCTSQLNILPQDLSSYTWSNNFYALAIWGISFTLWLSVPLYVWGKLSVTLYMYIGLTSEDIPCPQYEHVFCLILKAWPSHYYFEYLYQMFNLLKTTWQSLCFFMWTFFGTRPNDLALDFWPIT